MRPSTPKSRLMSLLQPRNTPQKPPVPLQPQGLKENLFFKNSLRDMLNNVHLTKMREINLKKGNDQHKYHHLNHNHSLGKRTPFKSDIECLKPEKKVKKTKEEILLDLEIRFNQFKQRVDERERRSAGKQSCMGKISGDQAGFRKEDFPTFKFAFDKKVKNQEQKAKETEKNISSPSQKTQA